MNIFCFFSFAVQCMIIWFISILSIIEYIFVEVHVFHEGLTFNWFLAGGHGDWRTDGCKITEQHNNVSVFHCYHLTNFVILQV